jgi:hypothetical protein
LVTLNFIFKWYNWINIRLLTVASLTRDIWIFQINLCLVSFRMKFLITYLFSRLLYLPLLLILLVRSSSVCHASSSSSWLNFRVGFLLLVSSASTVANPAHLSALSTLSPVRLVHREHGAYRICQC